MTVQDPAIVAAARCRPTDRTPVWFMRQAGRALPEYRRVRGPGSINDAIADAELAAEITLQPVRRYGVDAAVLFSDIMTPYVAMGVGVDIEPGVGPVVAQPFASEADLPRLRAYEPDVDAPYVGATVQAVVAELTVPLIGFAGAPFTVASYLIEGRPSRDHAKAKSLMRSDPDLWARLCDRIADISIATLTSQVRHGAQLVQLFDSWAGSLSPVDYVRHAARASTKIIDAVTALGVPSIHFGVGTAELLGPMADTGASVVGVDWRTPLDVARRRIADHTGRPVDDIAVQGNLDPTVVMAGWDATRVEADRVLAANGGHPGHIFNLGHGVLPDTDPGVLSALVEHVHESTTRP